MIINKLNKLDQQKLDLQLELNRLIQSPKSDLDKINEIQSEILYIDKQIEMVVGKKEIDRRKELKKKKLGIEETNRKNYYNFKSRLKKISPMIIATNRIIKIIENEKTIDEKVMVKS